MTFEQLYLTLSYFAVNTYLVYYPIIHLPSSRPILAFLASWIISPSSSRRTSFGGCHESYSRQYGEGRREKWRIQLKIQNCAQISNSYGQKIKNGEPDAIGKRRTRATSQDPPQQQLDSKHTTYDSDFERTGFKSKIQKTDYIIFMNSKKDSKRIKPHRQQKIHSTAPRLKNNDPDHTQLELLDLSPYRPIYGSYSISRQFHFNSAEMTIIDTPVARTPKSIYEDEIAQENKIKGVISFSDNEDQSDIEEEDSQILELSDEETEKSVEKPVYLNPEKVEEKPGNHYLRTAQPKQKREVPKKCPQVVQSTPKKVFCNCKKTKCLKLYCDCFRLNQVCDGCNCVGCHNLPIYTQQRNNSMMSLMDRNPEAFKPKIDEEQHAKGCHCKKSNCMKKYCECYQAGLKCGTNCKCEDCKNIEEEDEQPHRDGASGLNSLILNINNLMKDIKDEQRNHHHHKKEHAHEKSLVV